MTSIKQVSTLARMNNCLLKTQALFVCVVFLFAAILFFGCNSSTTVDVNEKPNTGKIQVGVYNGSGASAVCVIETLEALKIDTGIAGYGVSPVDIQNGILDELDVLIFPGGSGSKEYNSLGKSSDKLIKEFAAREGKGLVGICAGGYLFASTEGYPCLEIIEAQSIRDHYNRGRGLMAFTLNAGGKEIFPELAMYDSLFVQYYDGPIYEIADAARMDIIADIKSDIASHGNAPIGVTPGKPAFLTSQYGKGKVFVSVGHPESTPGLRWMVPRMARWTVDKPLVSYNEEVVKPWINNKAILYYPEIIKFENENFWELFSDTTSAVISAIDNLNSIRSRPSIRWSIGLLRSDKPEIRLAAANYLLETEYTFAIPDLECAVGIEKNQDVKNELEQILNKLKAIVSE
jgi:glutamine amidotransferase-like uncharacterized protein